MTEKLLHQFYSKFMLPSDKNFEYNLLYLGFSVIFVLGKSVISDKNLGLYA